MGTAERRKKIIQILCHRGHDTILNLANEFGVSERTISRDIELLSLTEPIYTQCGRYGGGVYIMPDYRSGNRYRSFQELEVLKKLALFVNNSKFTVLEKKEKDILENIILQYNNPADGGKYEKRRNTII